MKYLLFLLMICFVGCKGQPREQPPAFQFGVDTSWVRFGFAKGVIVYGPNIWSSSDTVWIETRWGKALLIVKKDTTGPDMMQIGKYSGQYEPKAAVVIDPLPREPWFQLNRPNGKIDSIEFSRIQSVTILYKGEIKTIRIDSMKANGSDRWLKPKRKN